MNTGPGADTMNASLVTDPSVPRGASWTARRRGRLAAMTALVPPLVLLLAACAGGSGNGGTAGGPSSAPSGQRTGPNGSGGGFGSANLPGASGLVAAASPGSLQVQGPDAQTTVTYTKATRFTQTVKGALAAGQCVMVTGTPASGSSDALTASSVRIQAKVNGSCPTATVGGPGGGGGRQGGASTAPRPSGTSPGPQGLPDFAFATGTVNSVSATTMTMQGLLREGGTRTSPSSPASPITVTLSSTTTVTETVAATSAAAVVGVCATAVGKADDRGDIAATSVTISKPDADGCRTRFGGFGGRGGGSGDTAGSGTNA
jgi:hypothetical protein